MELTFTLEEVVKAHGTRCGWVVNATPWPLYIWERDLLHIEQEAGWTPAPACMGAEDLAPPSDL
jgi:hypothetical protein